MYISICLSLSLYIYLSVYLSIYTSIYIYIYILYRYNNSTQKATVMTWGGRAAQLQPLLQEALRLIARAVEADVHGHGGALHHCCHRLQQLTTEPQTAGFSAGSIHFGAQIDIQYARECLLKR